MMVRKCVYRADPTQGMVDSKFFLKLTNKRATYTGIILV